MIEDAELISRHVTEGVETDSAELTRLYEDLAYSVAFRLNRTEQRRKAREQKANTMNELLYHDDPSTDWNQLGPVLEDARHKLDDENRTTVLRRQVIHIIHNRCKV